MEVNPIYLINRDTVASIGLVVPQSLPLVSVEANTTIRVFRQALSLDEVCGYSRFCILWDWLLMPTFPSVAPCKIQS
jgi:hypothetical protein